MNAPLRKLSELSGVAFDGAAAAAVVGGDGAPRETASCWHALNAAFATNQDPLNARLPRNPQFDRLFTRIVMLAPSPVGLGD